MATETVAAARIAAPGMGFVGHAPEAFAKTDRSEKPVWQTLLKNAGIKPA